MRKADFPKKPNKSACFHISHTIKFYLNWSRIFPPRFLRKTSLSLYVFLIYYAQRNTSVAFLRRPIPKTKSSVDESHSSQRRVWMQTNCLFRIVVELRRRCWRLKECFIMVETARCCIPPSPYFSFLFLWCILSYSHKRAHRSHLWHT